MSSTLITGGMIVRASKPSAAPDGAMTGREERADILIGDGVIKAIGTDLGDADETIDASGHLIFPGLIDCHVHFREPGFPHKATMESEAASARAGGVTTVCEMPNTDPPTVTAEAFADKVQRASTIKDCDIRFYFGVTEGNHIEELRKVAKDPAFCGVKLYLDDSTGNQKVEGGIIDEVFATCAELGIPLVAHCEDSGMNTTGTEGDVSLHSQQRPPESEGKSIEDAINFARKNGTHLHIAHFSTSFGMDHIRKAKKEGLKVTCEVAPHHLFFTEDDYARLGTLIKMNPPVRAAEHQKALWQGISDGMVDCIATDHAPHTLEEKQADPPLSAPSGVPGVETMLPLLLTVASEGRITYFDIVKMCFENPNNIFNLGKQGISEGAPANITIVDPNKKWTIKGSSLHSKCGWTPYEGMEVTGAVVRVV